VVFVLDRSMSMAQFGALDAARAELLACLRALPATTRFQVIPYNGFAQPLRVGSETGLLRADAATLKQVSRLLAELRPSGGTDHPRALRCGLMLHPDVLFFLTDADDLSLSEVGELTRLNQGRTAIHVIELNGRLTTRPDDPLRRLAESNRGDYRRIAPGG
jgi:hypothetical protein